MISARTIVLVFVTAPDLKVARKVARAVLKDKHAACANIVPKIESHYWWQGKLEKSGEVLIIFKTTQRCLAELEEAVIRSHPYDTPEVIALPLDRGNKRYLDWVVGSLKFKV
jgi:periplasmic divalent cation tolerance protein